MSKERRTGWLLAAIGMLLISTDSVFIRLADFDSWTVGFIFAAGSTITLLSISAATRTESIREVISRSSWPMAIITALAAASGLGFIAAVNHTAVANVVVIVGSTPMFASLFAWLFFGERPHPKVMVAIATVMTGVFIVVSGSVGSPTLRGDVIALLAILAFSITIALWRRYRDLDRPLTLATSSLLAALVALPQASLTTAPGRVFLAAGVMGLIFNPVARWSYANATRFAPASEVALFAPIETVAATVWAWWFFSEVPSWTTLVGGVVIIAAVIFGTLGQSSLVVSDGASLWARRRRARRRE